METSGTHKLAAQHDNYGYFAEVSVNVMLERGDAGLRVEFSEGTGSAWRAGASFGLAYAFEKSPMAEVRGKRVVVRVTSIRGHAVDTTEVLIAYASAKAFWQAVGVSPPQEPVLDQAGGSVVFPK
jgi:hypothetical protein